MHMSDALISPIVGAAGWAVAAGAIAVSVKKMSAGASKEGGALDGGRPHGLGLDERKAPIMGVMGAFVFAAQMLNFAIPVTGSSGHIGGGLLLAATLGPFPALITLASVLLIQCLFFADGGLLAYGWNVVNMGLTSSVLAFTLIYAPIVKKGLSKKSITFASILAAVAGLQVGALGVVLETTASGVTELPFGAFLLLMQPIHLAIGFIEGVITAAVLCFVHSARPALLEDALGSAATTKKRGIPVWAFALVVTALALVAASVISLFASSNPDGLEWSIAKTAGETELEREGAVYSAAESIVEKTAFLPDYEFKRGGGAPVAGAAGSLITLLVAGGIGGIIHIARRRSLG